MFIVLHRNMGVTFLMYYFQQLFNVLNYVALSLKSCLEQVLVFVVVFFNVLFLTKLIKKD